MELGLSLIAGSTAFISVIGLRLLKRKVSSEQFSSLVDWLMVSGFMVLLGAVIIFA